MFNLSYFSKSELAGTINFKSAPKSLGNLEDIDGNIWNINAIIGNHVCACRLSELHPYYSSTSSFCNYGLVSQTWKPYAVKVISKEE